MNWEFIRFVKPCDREVPQDDYECSAYDTEPSGCCLPSGNLKMSFHNQHLEDKCGFDSNVYKHGEYHPQQETNHNENVHFNFHKPTYAEPYESIEGTSGYRDDYRREYPGQELKACEK
uniref:Tes110 n=1 Tax=Angiostrongylus cantonensis TaxID=6313 RepID=A0A0K0D9Z9_ANGCA